MKHKEIINKTLDIVNELLPDSKSVKFTETRKGVYDLLHIKGSCNDETIDIRIRRRIQDGD